jgi:hypothetical protein
MKFLLYLKYMKKLAVVLLFFLAGKLLAQSTKNEFILPDNRYTPYHTTIKDSATKTIRDFGHYFSVGFTPAKQWGVYGTTTMISYSLAYKKHVFSATLADKEVGNPDPQYKDTWASSHYAAILYGQSLRFKYLLVSLSAGLSLSRESGNEPKINLINWNPAPTLAIPLELKMFILARNGIGLGIHLAQIMPIIAIGGSGGSGFFIGLSVVLGSWNKANAPKHFTADSVFIYSNYIAKGTTQQIKKNLSYLDSTKATKNKLSNTNVAELNKLLVKPKRKDFRKQTLLNDNYYAIVYNGGRKNKYVIECNNQQSKLINLTNMSYWQLKDSTASAQLYNLINKVQP